MIAAALLLAQSAAADKTCADYFGAEIANNPLVTIMDPDVPNGYNTSGRMTFVHKVGNKCHVPAPPVGCHRYFATWYDNCAALSDPQATTWAAALDTAGRFATEGDNVGVLKECAGGAVKQEVMCFGPPASAPTRCPCPNMPNHTSVHEAAVGSLAPYPGYSGTLKVSGSIQFTAPMSKPDDVKWQLSGADPLCPASVANACGVHVHQGTDCGNKDTVGGHFFSQGPHEFGSDPWLDMRYVADASGASANSHKLRSGYTPAMQAGHTFVVHDSTGARAACGIVGADGSVPSFSPYPGYGGPLKVTGSVRLSANATEDATLVNYEWDLKGADPACTAGMANACGIHIHAGTDCGDKDTIGGHFYDADAFTTVDPWSVIKYVSDSSGAAAGHQPLRFGKGLDQAAGHTVVVHDSAGGRIACGKLAAGRSA